jgi:hypothetical protein
MKFQQQNRNVDLIFAITFFLSTYEIVGDSWICHRSMLSGSIQLLCLGQVSRLPRLFLPRFWTLRLRGACEEFNIPRMDDLTRELSFLMTKEGLSTNKTAAPPPEKWCDEDWPLDPLTGKRTYGPWFYESDEYEQIPALHESNLVVSDRLI